jgi:hypothetical protein
MLRNTENDGSVVRGDLGESGPIPKPSSAKQRAQPTGARQQFVALAGAEGRKIVG